MSAAPNQVGIRKCDHCKIAFRPRHEDEEFCCGGCRFVHDLINQEGLDNFYELLGNRSLVPLKDQPTADSDLEWLKKYDSDDTNSLTVRIANLSCTACVWLIERIFRRHPGGVNISINLSRSTMTIRWTGGDFDLIEFAKELHRYGYPISELTDQEIETDSFSESRALMTRLGVTAGLALNTMAFSLPSYLGLEFSDDLAGLFRLVAFASSTVALLVGGSWFFQRAIASFRARVIHMDVPISLGLIAAYAGSIFGWLLQNEELFYFDFVATFVTLMLLGRWLHVRMIEHNRNQLRARERAIVSLKKKNKDGEFQTVTPSEIKNGDLIEIAPGSLIPIKSVLQSKNAMASLDWINGEPAPVHFRIGQTIAAGARNSGGEPFLIETIQDYKGSLVEKLLNSETETAQVDHSRVLQIYLFTVIAIALGGGIWWWIHGNELVRALQVLISILVVSCPCAIGLALPLVDEIINARMRRIGVFVRKNKLWQKLPKVKRVIFDKTGTLTEADPKLLNPEVIQSLDRQEIDILYHLNRENPHPYGASIREVLFSRFGSSLKKRAGEMVEIVPSRGTRVAISGSEWRFGKASWATPDSHDTATILSRDGEEIARFQIGEQIRDGSEHLIQWLRKASIPITILSGDPEKERVSEIANRAGIDPEDVYYSQSAEQKAAFIENHHPEETLFIGDGGNDGFALDAALCSGSPATGIRAIEARTDFVFADRSFRVVEKLFRCAARRLVMVRSIFLVAVFYNIAAIGVCLTGSMNPLLAAILMPLSSVLTVAMASRV